MTLLSSFLTSIGVIIYGMATASIAYGQIVPDKSLNTRVNTRVNQDSKVIEINGGSQAGKNLFHSFKEFSVPKDVEAFFNNNPSIANIFSRVTGVNISKIQGLIRANNANLILINPNGIIFSEGAQLNLGKGSFLATTAESLIFKDGTVFSATDATLPLLTISTPIGLNIGSRARPIEVKNASLQVEPGETLSLIGGRIDLEGGNLIATDGKIDLGGLSQIGTVKLGVNFSADYPQAVEKSDIFFKNFNLSALGFNGGNIKINARNISLFDNSEIATGILFDSGSPKAVSGDIKIFAKDITLSQGSSISNLVWEEGYGKAGNIEITAKSLLVTNGAKISTKVSGQGEAGKIKIKASDTVTFDGEGLDVEDDGTKKVSYSGAFSEFYSPEPGQVGGVEIAARHLFVTNGAYISAITSGNGDAGGIIINASETVNFSGKAKDGAASGVFGNVDEGASGKVGGIALSTKFLNVTNGARLNASTLGTGDAGDIEITTVNLNLSNGSQIFADTFGQGNAGSVSIKAENLIRLDGEDNKGNRTGIASQVNRQAIGGNAGGVEISAGSLWINNGAFVAANTFGKGKAGSVNINVTQEVILEGRSKGGKGSGIFSSSNLNALGSAGDVNITSPSLFVNKGARISSSSLADGKPAGNININASSVELSQNSKITTFASLDASDGGNILITADSILAFSRSDIVATSDKGKGGNIQLNTSAFFGEGYFDDSRGTLQQLDTNKRVDVSASGLLSKGSVATPNVSFVQNSLAKLSNDLINTDRLIANSCLARSQKKLGSFVLVGIGGLPLNPNDLLPVLYPTVEVKSVESLTKTPSKTPENIQEVVEPDGFYSLENGSIILGKKCP